MDSFEKAAQIRERFESEMINPRQLVTGLVGKFFVPLLHEIRQKKQSWALAVNHCSEVLKNTKEVWINELKNNMVKTSTANNTTVNDWGRTKLDQQITSTIGKGYERFTAYSLSKSLENTNWAIWKDRADIKDVVGVGKKELLGFVKNGIDPLEIEADFIAFHAASPLDYPMVLCNCKTSLKERLHQATMWAMTVQILRDSYMSAKFNMTTESPILKKCKYILITGDVAAEQPDLRKKARKLLQFDFSFFDATFAAITEEWNAEMPSHYDATQMCRMSAVREMLISLE